MTHYRIIADTARTFGLRNEATGQIDHGSFSTITEVRSFYRAQFGFDPSYRLEG